jgi:hypothetical protein
MEPKTIGLQEPRSGRGMVDMTVSEKRAEEVAGDQPLGGPEQGAGDAEPPAKRPGREKQMLICNRESGTTMDFSRKNHRAKLRMAEELLQMGFSREAVSRILNVNLDHEETL